MNYLIFSMLVIVFIPFSYFTSNEKSIKYFIHNLSFSLLAGFVGSLITAFSIEEYYKAREESNRARFEKIALHKINSGSKIIFETFLEMYASHYPEIGAVKATNFRELFNDAYFGKLRSINLKTETGSIPPTNWAKRISFASSKLESDFSIVINSYAQYLPSEKVELIESIKSSSVQGNLASFNVLVMNAPPGFDNSYFLGDPGFNKALKNWLYNLVSLVEICNREVSKKLEPSDLLKTMDLDEVLKGIEPRNTAVQK